MFKSIFVALIVVFSVNINAFESGDAASALAEKFAKLRTYQSDFEQRVYDENGKEIDFSSGTFSIEKPDHFRWEIKQKFSQLIIADGKHLWTYDKDLEQVTIQYQSKMLADSPLLLLTSDSSRLANAFDISLINVEDNPDHLLFQLKPKQEDGVFESVHILFEAEKIAELLMTDSLGQKTSVKFINAKVNPKLTLDLFIFKVPEGVDVVDSREVKAATN
ncbi:outer membrane lipoprotein chaperone LolA [Aliikangiella sp. IMCC44359]|uniref:outer membrane lipoprotein chaperone LolA n=1 Tax=Aliikangiella sp. IMCC44359 TaxID=3459125 RepID=UPI00403AD69B